MNYDKAHDLAHAMRESEEYKELMAAQEAVKADAVATALVRTFMAEPITEGMKVLDHGEQQQPKH